MLPDLTSAPDWFQTAVATPSVSKWLDIDCAAIHYLAWNDTDTHKPPLIFVHGYRGHARWWSAIAPYFMNRFRVYAMDFSGMGDSATRPEYDAASPARDLAGLIQHAGLAPATVVAHSFGGSRTLRVCADYPGLIEHAVIVDTYFCFADTDPPRPSRSIGFGKVFPDYQSLRQRYRLMPDQPVAFPEILNYLAYHSARQTEAGWCWKFDPTLPTTTHEVDSNDLLTRTANRVDIVVGELSVVLSAECAQRVVKILRHGRGPVIMPQAHHHIMLDQPLALIGVLRALLA